MERLIFGILRYSLLKFVYVIDQSCHPLVVYPLLRKIQDPPLNTYLTTYICFHKSSHSSLELRWRPKNIIAILNLFFSVRAWIIDRLYFLLSIVRETSRSSFRYTWLWIGTTRCLRLNKSCWPKILYRKNYGDKNGSKSFQQQRKMFCRKFGWPSMKVFQIKVGGRKLFGCSLKHFLPKADDQTFYLFIAKAQKVQGILLSVHWKLAWRLSNKKLNLYESYIFKVRFVLL